MVQCVRKSSTCIINLLDVFCRPDIINYSLLRPSQHEANLNNAFNIAEESLGITKLLDAEGKCRYVLLPCSFHLEVD